MSHVTIVTHNGTFHPDDVFAVAALKILHTGTDVLVIRSRQAADWQKGDYVIDVGGQSDGVRFFDHHQHGGAGSRPNGIPYASFGLVWKAFGPTLCQSSQTYSIADQVDKRLVAYIDAMDNGIGQLKPVAADIYPFTLSQVIFQFLPHWNQSRSDMDERFLKAVALAKEILSTLIADVKIEEQGKAEVQKIYENSLDKKIIVLDINYPWEEILTHYKEPLYVIEPSGDDGKGGDTAHNWKVKAVRKEFPSFESRKAFPQAWAGKQNEELQKISGVSDAIFCHNMRFIAVAKSFDGAMRLAQLALEA